MKKVLADIQSGEFAREFIAEHRSGNKHFTALREAEKKHPIEEVGARLRGMMDWLPDATKSTAKKDTKSECVNSIPVGFLAPRVLIDARHFHRPLPFLSSHHLWI